MFEIRCNFDQELIYYAESKEQRRDKEQESLV